MKKDQDHKALARLGRSLSAALLLLAALATVFAAPSQAEAQSIIKIAATSKTRSISVPISKPTTFRTDAPFAEIVVGDPSLAIVTPLTDQSFYVVGAKKGTTGIVLFNEAKELIGSLDVEIAPDANRINESLRAALGETGVTARTKNGNVMITGEAPVSRSNTRLRGAVDAASS